jgi:predicted nuclease with TOPRIM domain
MEELEDLRRANARLKGQLEEEQNEKEEKESELRLSNIRLEESRDLVSALEAKNNKLRSSFDIEREDLKE